MSAAARILEAPQPAERSSAALRALPSVRSQAAFVRALLEEVERVAPPGVEGLREQLADELARLGNECIALARALRAEPR